MVRIDLAQKAIIRALKANAPLVAVLGNPNKITESQFQGQEIGYPTVKVDMGSDSPIGNGTDHIRLSRLFWSIQIFTEDFSSANANKIMGLVMNALFQTQILGLDDSELPTFRFLRIDLTNQTPALRLTNRLWKAEIFFESEIHPVNDDPRNPT